MDAVLPEKLNKHLVYQKPKDVSHSSTMGVYLTGPRTTIRGCSDLKGEEAGETLSSVFLPRCFQTHLCKRPRSKTFWRAGAAVVASVTTVKEMLNSRKGIPLRSVTDPRSESRGELVQRSSAGLAGSWPSGWTVWHPDRPGWVFVEQTPLSGLYFVMSTRVILSRYAGFIYSFDVYSESTMYSALS